MVKKNADGSVEVSFELSKAQVQYLSETPLLEILRLDCGGEVLVPYIDSAGLWLAFSWSRIVKREVLYCNLGTGCGVETEHRRGSVLPPETADELKQIEQYRSGMRTPPEPKESVVMCFRNGCVAAYVEQDDGTYKVVINGDMYPRHLRLINQVIDLFKECSKEDRPEKFKVKRLSDDGK